MLDIDKFFICGNHLSLDFVNTKLADGAEAVELLKDQSDMAAWAVAVRLIDKDAVKRSLEKWMKDGKMLREALSFRATLYELFTGIISRKIIADSAIKEINERLGRQAGSAELVRSDTGFEKRFRTDFNEPGQLLASIASSAADLLCYGNLDLIKKCEGENCVLYFYDTTKNHSRRWCSMAHCGNRAKAKAFYKRKVISVPDKGGY